MTLTAEQLRARALRRPGAALRDLVPHAVSIAGVAAEMMARQPRLYAEEPPHFCIIARREAWRTLLLARRARAEAEALRARQRAGLPTGGGAA